MAKSLNDIVSNDIKKEQLYGMEEYLKNISANTYTKIASNPLIKDLFPDIDDSINVLILSILSPNDMLQRDIRFISETQNIDTGVLNRLLSATYNHFVTNYNFVEESKRILKESLVTKGAYIHLFFPQAILRNYFDKDLNKKAVEDFMDSLSILNNTDEFNVKQPFGVSVTENWLSISEKRHEYNSNLNMFSNTLESFTGDYIDKLDTHDFDGEKEEILFIDNLATSDKKDGIPLSMSLPTESVIPISPEDEPFNHIGYFVLLNSNGRPISGKEAVTDDVLYNEFEQYIEKKNNNKLMGEISSAIFDEKKNNQETLDAIANVYENTFMKNLKETFKNGKYALDVSVDTNNEFMKLMLYRYLRNKKTEWLYVPKEMISYIAFNYRDDGTGESLLERIETLASLRAMVMYSNLNGHINKHISKNLTTVTLDDSLDPMETSEKIKSAHIKNSNPFPNSIKNVPELTNWLSNLQQKFKFIHPDLPTFEVETSEVNTGSSTIDTEIEQELAERMIRTLGVPPKLVMDKLDSDFAVKVIWENSIYSTKLIGYQNTYSQELSKMVIKLIQNDTTLLKEYETILKDDISKVKKTVGRRNSSEKKVIKLALNMFLKGLKVKFPSITEGDEDATLKTIKNYKETVEYIVEVFFSSDAFPEEYTGMTGDKLKEMQDILVNHFVRKWIVSNGFYKEIYNFMYDDSLSHTVFTDDYAYMLNSIGEMLTDFMKKNKRVVREIDKKLKKMSSSSDDADEDSDGQDNDVSEPDNNSGDSIDDSDNDIDTDVKDE
jgi:hypothetical protein